MGHPPVEAAASVSEAAAFPSLNTLGRLLCCPEARDAEVLIERPDGSRITVVVNIRPLKNGRDDIIGAVNCFYDVTARKETEEALRVGPPQERVPGDARPRAPESARTNPPLSRSLASLPEARILAVHRSVAGLGIGLTLVKTLAQMHGGTVEVSSAGVGQGSEFIVRLPITMGMATLPPPAMTREPAVTASPLRILIVDDNRDAAEMLAMLLQFSGHDTHTAHDGVEAVEAATELQPDVVLLDIGLPRLNGYEAARRIREQQRLPSPFLVAVTGWGQDEDRRRSEEAGFDAHLVKPVDETALGKLLADRGARKREVGL